MIRNPCAGITVQGWNPPGDTKQGRETYPKSAYVPVGKGPVPSPRAVAGRPLASPVVVGITSEAGGVAVRLRKASVAP